MTMVPWLEILIVIYAYTGLVVGLLLSKIAHEELKPGKKYFHIAKIIVIFSLLMFTYLFGLKNLDFSSFLWAFIGMMLGLFKVNEFLFLGIGTVFFSARLSIVFAALVFAYGMICQAVDFSKKIFFQNSLYYLIPVLFLFSFNILRVFTSEYSIPLLFGVFMAYSYKYIVE